MSWTFSDLVFYLQMRMYGFSSHYQKNSSGNIHYYLRKCPDAQNQLVFIHGIGACAGHYGAVFNELKNSKYTIYAPDLPSHGRSSDLDQDSDAEKYYQTFVSWINQTVSGPFVLIGNSLGGGLSLRYALEHPERIQKLILVSPAGGFEDQEEWLEFKQGIYFKSVNDSLNFLRRIYCHNPAYLPIFSVFFYRTMMRKGIRNLIENASISDFTLDLQVLSKQVPILFIWGKSERVFPAKHLDYFKKNMPTHVTFDEPIGIGHCPQLDDPKWFSKRILEFVAE